MDYSYEVLDLLKKYDGDEAEALLHETNPLCLYAFSPLRRNLYEWVEFNPQGRLLEIGSDYGALTGLFSERVKETVVVDEYDENLLVNQTRHKGRDSIRYVRAIVLHDGIEYKEYPPVRKETDRAEEWMKEPFDYVVVSGILNRFPKEEAWKVLSYAAGFLKEGGTLYAAAENELGLRYWMGAEKYDGSFEAAEFDSLFQGLTEKFGGTKKMYYPVPDFRYPMTVYSDSYLPETGDVSNISARLERPGFLFGDEDTAMAKVTRNGMFPKMANSFLGVFQKGNV